MSELLPSGVLVEPEDVIEITIDCGYCDRRYAGVRVAKLQFARPVLICGKCGYQIAWGIPK